MISLKIPMNMVGGDSVNPWFYTLESWKPSMEMMGMIYVPNGSNKTSIEPGTWFVQTYSLHGGVWNDRHICFHPSDRLAAMRFILEWFP